MWTKRARALIATVTVSGAFVVGSMLATPDTYHDLKHDAVVESVTTPDTPDTYHDL
jgi:hypothetical protein